MKNVTLAFMFACGLATSVVNAEETKAIALTPNEMVWSSQGNLAKGGIEQAVLQGDPNKPGPYTLRLKFPPNTRLEPHSHPDTREVTVISGVWRTGYGSEFDSAKLKDLVAGSWYTEPKGIDHFVQTDVETVVQVSGMGPSGRIAARHKD